MPEPGYTKRRAKWTADDIIAKVIEWDERHGEPPTATDWNPSDCRSAAARSSMRAEWWMSRVIRFGEGEYPWSGSVSKVFGTWNEAIRAAGKQPRNETRPPAYHHGDVRTLTDLSRSLTRARRARDVTLKQQALYELAHDALAIAAELDA